MDWLERMNSAIDHIETNLADNISYDEIAQIACCSTYHFQRKVYISNIMRKYMRKYELLGQERFI